MNAPMWSRQMKSSRLLRGFAGTSGALSALFLMVWVPIMISLVPAFSYSSNWISDLGGMGSAPYGRPDVTTPQTQLMLTMMLVVVGSLRMPFALGLMCSARTPLYRYAGECALASGLSTIGFAVFTEDTLGGIPHLLFALAHFLLLAAAALLAGFSYRASGNTGLGNFSLAWGLWMLIGLPFYFHFRGVGETIQWLQEATWIALMSAMLLDGSAARTSR